MNSTCFASPGYSLMFWRGGEPFLEESVRAISASLKRAAKLFTQEPAKAGVESGPEAELLRIAQVKDDESEMLLSL